MVINQIFRVDRLVGACNGGRLVNDDITGVTAAGWTGCDTGDGGCTIGPLIGALIGPLIGALMGKILTPLGVCT